MKLNTLDKVKIINLKVVDSNNASINIIEDLDKLIPIKRIFTVLISNFKNDKRGRHAHKIDNQIVFCSFGSIKFTVTDGLKTKNFILNDRTKAVYVPCHIWTETDYLEDNTVVTCYCSENFNENNYIRKFDEFLKFRNL
jgi:dTDP-4-dehydrorhamnose 3,5-epimerase-like enzyme